MRAPIDRGSVHTRIQAAEFRAADDDPNSRRLSMAVSSDVPVERMFGNEVLDHRAECVDLTFFGSGRAPLLNGHNADAQIGVVESASLDGNRLRAIVRFSKSTAATEVLDDIRDGIRGNVSIGYRVHDFEPTPDGDGFRVTKWAPKEVSIVSIPADETVGVGRSVKGNQTMNSPVTNETDERVEAIAEIYSLAARHGMANNKVRDWLTPERKKLPAETMLAQFRRYVLDNLPRHEPISAPHIQTDARYNYSVTRAIAAQVTGDWKRAGFELEIARELANRLGRQAEGFYVPTAALSERATITSAGVPEMFGTEHLGGMFIEALKPFAAVMSLSPTVISGLTKDAHVPKQGTGSHSEWVGENTAPTDSAPTSDAVSLAYHQLSTTEIWSRKVAIQADPAFESITRKDMLREIGVAVDRAAIMGSGIGAEPLGILGTAGVGSVAFGTDGGAPTWSKMLEFLEAVEVANIVGNNMAFLTNHRVKRKLMTTERSTGGTAKFIVDDENAEMLAGYRAAYSGNVPADGTKGSGTDLSAMIFGNWSDLLIGQFGALDIIVDPYTESAKGNVRLTIHSSWDIAVRHPESFAVATDIDTTP